MGQVAKDETSPIIAATKVEGTPVFNMKNEKLGTIEDIMIDKRSGKVAYAVMSFGGFLGMGESHHPLPWPMLRYDPSIGAYFVNLDRKALEGAPYYGAGERIDWADERWGRKVHDYYGVAPFWL